MKLEELESVEEELEPVFRQIGFSSDIPLITVMGKHMYFNAAFARLLQGTGYIKFYTTSSYVIMLPQDHASSAVFKLYASTGTQGKTLWLPATIREKKLKNGYYKVYKYKNGWAIKRYEPMEALL